MLLGKDTHKILNLRVLPQESRCNVEVKKETRFYDLHESLRGHWQLEFRNVWECEDEKLFEDPGLSEGNVKDRAKGARLSKIVHGSIFCLMYMVNIMFMSWELLLWVTSGVTHRVCAMSCVTIQGFP